MRPRAEKSPCSFHGCVYLTHSHGLCKSHRQQQLRGKNLSELGPTPGSIPIENRFWEKVDKTPHCWVWVGHKRPQGYGILNRNGRYEYAHRLVFEILGHPPVPAEMVVDHICFNSLCVNPAHLRIVTNKLNCEYSHRGSRKVPASGYRGVYRNHDKWMARVVHNGKNLNLGSFSNPEDASRVVAEKRRELFAYPEYQPISGES